MKIMSLVLRSCSQRDPGLSSFWTINAGGVVGRKVGAGVSVGEAEGDAVGEAEEDAVGEGGTTLGR